MSFKLAIFISGKGSNLESVLKNFPNLKPRVYADKDCEGLIWAKKHDCSYEIISLKTDSDWISLVRHLNELKISHILLLGFMKIIPKIFLSDFKGEEIINLHPSLLPSYPGLNAIKRAYYDKAALGATLHTVTEGIDEGPILIQKKALRADTFIKTKQNVHLVEHEIVKILINKLKAKYLES